jgi:DNA-binding NtrC family response regulator
MRRREIRPTRIGSGECDDVAVILVVEDEAQVLVLAESYLREQGHQTFSASSVAEALAVLDRAETIDVLITDIGLMDEREGGLVLAREAIKRRPNVRVLYTTGQAVTDGTRALLVEGSALLEKPYTVDQLAASLSVHFKVGPQPYPPVQGVSNLGGSANLP